MKNSVRFVVFEYFAYANFIKTLNEYCSIRLCYRMNTSEIYLKLLCKGICYALSLCKVKALLNFQNLHTYGSYFGDKPCIDVHNTFLMFILVFSIN